MTFTPASLRSRAVLEEVRVAGIDQIVVEGDAVPGPVPREALALLLGLEIPVELIHGDGELASFR